jgi:hypothetical protein
VVASAITKGTSSRRASVCANKVLPEPVGPMSKILLLANSTPSTIAFAGNFDFLVSAADLVSLESAAPSNFSVFGAGKYCKRL